jgi:superfamily II DNA or RNA helicase/tetratricopeptide (TPR) repeat protein
VDIAADRSQEGKSRLEAIKENSRLFAMRLPSSLDDAALLMIALSFGPLDRNNLVRALKQAGMTMPDGSTITPEKVKPCIQRLKAKGHIIPLGSAAACLAKTRTACIDAARKNGWLDRFGQALQEAVPGQVNPGDWEYKWGGRRFMSFDHACRDVFLALERNDQNELKRLAGLCSLDMQTGSLVKVLVAVCLEPFQPAYLERLPRQYRDLLLSEALYRQTCALALDHPVFAYARTWILNNRQDLDASLLRECINYLAERDILAGDLKGARALLDTFAEVETPLLRGMLELLSGRIDEAHQAYDLALQRLGKAKKAQLERLATFPGVLHCLLLIQSERPQDRRQARTWLDWLAKNREYMVYHQTYYFLDRMLGWHEGRDDADVLYQSFYSENSFLARVSMSLLQLLYWFYASGTEAVKAHKRTMVTEMQDLLRHCKEHGARWPIMQLSRLMSRLDMTLPAGTAAAADAFFQEAAVKDLAELWAVKEIWESRVGALEQLIRQAELAADQSSTQSRRLVWKLREWSSGRMAVIPVEQKRTKAGGWTKGREVSSYHLSGYPEEAADFLTDQDKAALTTILMAHDFYYRGADIGAILPILVGHPNVFWEDRPHVPVEIVAGKPEVHIVPKGKHLHISLAPYPSEDADGVLDASTILHESQARLRVIVFEPKHLKMAEILGPEGVTIPKDRSEEALKRLQGLSKHVAIQSDVALAAAEAESIEPNCHPHLRLQRLEQGLQAEMVVVPLGEPSQRAFAPGIGNAHLVESFEGRTVQTRRNLEEETVQTERALDAVPLLRTNPGKDYSWIVDDPTEALELLEQLQAVPPEVLTVEWPKGDPITVRSLSPQQFHLSIHSAQDWFEVEGEVQVDQDLMIKMRTLLDQIENSDTRFIALGKDQYIALTRQLRKQLQWLAAGGQYVGKGDTLRMHPLAAVGLEQWKDEIGQFKADAVFNAHLEKLRKVESYQPAIPSTLQATLRPYQADGFVWLARLAEWGVGACLADDMGLGKTVQALALILHRASQGPTLVAAPTSVCANWVFEAQRFAPTLRPVRFGIGDLGRRDEVLKALGPFDLVICSYTLLQQEAEAIKGVRFATIVLDEAQMIKNAATKRSSAAMNLTGGFRMMCTGTPIENRLAELWNLFRFINPGLLGSEERFRERFVRPIEGQRDSYASHILKSLVQPFILRRTKSQVLEDLPSRTELMRMVELSDEERALHESLRRRALERLEGMRHAPGGQAHIQVLAELMKLRRCCCNPRLVMPACGLKGSKLEAFAELVDELLENQHKALVFSQFVDHLTLLREHLDERKIRYQYLDGQTPPKTRQKRIDAFQNGEGDLFLISLKAGGLGLNLTAADYVIHMDPWWNPAVEDQASDRAHRIGQTRPVTIYRLVAADTIEEKIVQLHHAKRDLADSLLEGTDTAHTLTADDLIDLLRNR